MTDMRLKGGHLCPRCNQEFKSEACHHDWSDVIRFNEDERIKGLVREEVRRLVKPEARHIPGGGPR